VQQRVYKKRLQFHPEYDTKIMRAYIREQSEVLESAGQNVSGLLHHVRETPFSEQVLKTFARIVQKAMMDNCL
jgi:GMP synthase (glutamine-hydrolysing)